ncbi:IS1182 family transposase [Clostridium septicum]|nr:transposase [Clostridium septicum]QAS61083.1 IS1182 family transposase [Clostridium septicum]
MKNFTKNVIPMHQIGFPIQVPFIPCEDDSVRLLFKVTEGLDYTRLYNTYSTLGRNPVIDPVILFRILIYGYMNKLYSSREIEKACKRDINFIWLLQGQKAPDYNTIARFRVNRLENCIDDLFNQLICKLGKMEEIKYKNIFIDGTKIEANANKYTFVWKKTTDKFEAKLQKKINLILSDIFKDFKINVGKIEGKISVEKVKAILSKLDDIKIANNITFVQCKGKRKSALQKYIESLEEFIEKQSKYDDYNNTFNGRNSFPKTDKDATFMHMKEDHMKNGQWYLSEHKQNSYIKPQTYEKSKSKKFKNDISKRENMNYDVKNDIYICAFGKRIVPVSTKYRTSKSGYISEITIYECENCNDCPYKNTCTKAKGNKRLHVSKDFIKYREKSLNKITTHEGKLLRMNRSIQVECAFGVLKQDYGFRRFLLRGKKNIKIEFLLLCFAYDIKKLFNKTLTNINRILLHKMKME